MTRSAQARLVAVLVLAAFAGTAAVPAARAGESLTDPAVQQIREYAAFHAGDEWVETELRILAGLCAEQDKRAREVRAALAAAPSSSSEADRAVVAAIGRHFETLAQNEALVLQDIALWQIQKRRRFDPNFLHNLVARSAINAYRLERKARVDPKAVLAPDNASAPRTGESFDAALGWLATRLQALCQDPLSADPSLTDAQRRAQLEALTAKERERVASDTRVIAFPLPGPERFGSFFEVVQAIYPEKWIHAHGFGDVYELTQFLAAAELQGKQPNAPYAVGPFSLSRLTEDLTRPEASQPPMLLTTAYFTEGGAPALDEAERDPLRFLAKSSKRSFTERDLPARAWTLHKYLRAAPSKPGSERSVSQEVYENRLFVLTGMSDQGFYERYRSVRNDRLFFEQAEAKLGLDELKRLLREPYTVPGGDFVLPRHELLELTRSQLDAETSMQALLKRIPQKVHIDFIRPVIVAIFDRLTPAERDAMGKQRVREIAEHFGSPAGVVGNPEMLRQFLALFGEDVRAGARALAAEARVSELEAAKWIVILLAVESRGNLFAVSPTGAIGPFQHTYYFYLKTEPASIPFDPRKSAIKTGKELGKLYSSYLAAGPAEGLDLAVASYNQGAGAVRQARAAGDWRSAIAPEGRRYVESVRKHLTRLAEARSFEEVVRGISAGP